MIKNINFKANIQENAHDLVASSKKDVKGSVAYNIDVPADSAPYTTVKKIGGMTRKCTNLANIVGRYNTTISDGVVTQIEPDTNNSPILKMQQSSNDMLVSDKVVAYAMSIGEVTTTFELLEGVDRISFGVNGSARDTMIYIDTEDLPRGYYTFSCEFTNITQGSISWKDNQLNPGQTALPYEPYFEGLRSAKVTEVESVGVNLFDKSKVTVTETETGFSFTNTGANSAPMYIGLLKDIAPNLRAGDSVTFYADVINASRLGDFLYLAGSARDWHEGVFLTITDGDLNANVFAYGAPNVVCEYANVIFTKTANAPYTPYVHHTLPIPVEVRGSMNLIPYPYSESIEERHGIDMLDMGDGRIRLNGTASSSFSYTFVNRDADTSYLRKGKKYTFKFTNISPSFSTIYAYVQERGTENYYYAIGDGVTFTATQDGYVGVHLVIIAGFVANNLVISPMLNEGTTALPYEPYSAVKGLDGYGLGVSDTVYNYIDWEKKQFVKRCASVDLGTLSWGYHDLYSRFHSGSLSGVVEKSYLENYSVCALEYNSKVYYDADRTDGYCISEGNIYVRNSAYTDAETLKAAMSGVMLVYELATPEVTDISDLISADNFIGVEGNGTLTFKNAYEYAVPSEVTLYEGGTEIVGSKTFVGDLIGEAGRAKKATMAVYDESGNKIDETYLPKSGGTLGGQVVANESAVTALETKQVRNIYAGTSDLTAGSSALPTGDIYIVYE